MPSGDPTKCGEKKDKGMAPNLRTGKCEIPGTLKDNSVDNGWLWDKGLGGKEAGGKDIVLCHGDKFEIMQRAKGTREVRTWKGGGKPSRPSGRDVGLHCDMAAAKKCKVKKAPSGSPADCDGCPCEKFALVKDYNQGIFERFKILSPAG